MQSGRNERRDKGKRLPGVLDQIGRSKLKILRIVVEQGGKWLKNHYPTEETPQTAPPPSQVPKATRFALSDGNHLVPHSVSVPELDSSSGTHNECHAAQKQTTALTRLKPSPPKSTKQLFTQAYLNEVSEWLRKRMAAKAQQPPAGLEKTQNVRKDVNHIEKGQKDTSRMTKQGYKPLHPPSTLPPLCTTQLDVSTYVEHPHQGSVDPPRRPSAPLSCSPSSLHPYPSHCMQTDTYLCVGTTTKQLPSQLCHPSSMISLKTSHHAFPSSTMKHTQPMLVMTDEVSVTKVAGGIPKPSSHVTSPVLLRTSEHCSEMFHYLMK